MEFPMSMVSTSARLPCQIPLLKRYQDFDVPLPVRKQLLEPLFHNVIQLDSCRNHGFCNDPPICHKGNGCLKITVICERPENFFFVENQIIEMNLTGFLKDAHE